MVAQLLALSLRVIPGALCRGVRTAAVLALFCSLGSAGPISFTGSLDPLDANSFFLTQELLFGGGVLRVEMWSYGGGINAQGTSIPAGGFAPYVSVFSGADETAVFVASGTQGVCPPANPNPACYDVSLELPGLAAGSYLVAITTFPNMSIAGMRATQSGNR